MYLDFFDRKETNDRIWQALYEDLQKRGYVLGKTIYDCYLQEDREDDIRVYVAIMKMPKEEFFRKYLSSRKVTLGNLCEVEVIE